MADKGNHLDLSCGTDSQAAGAAQKSADSRAFLGVHFECCDVYSRVYPNREQTAYLGHCPRCAKQVKFMIGESGTSSRFFSAR